jgi:hypothetical protein
MVSMAVALPIRLQLRVADGIVSLRPRQSVAGVSTSPLCGQRSSAARDLPRLPGKERLADACIITVNVEQDAASLRRPRGPHPELPGALLPNHKATTSVWVLVAP